TIANWKTWARWPFLLVALVFVYTTLMNVYERPEGLKIASIFIGTMIVTSLISRALRATELRICEVVFDERASALVADDLDRVIRLIARRPRPDETEDHLDVADREMRQRHGLTPDEQVIFLEVDRGDASEFEE